EDIELNDVSVQHNDCKKVKLTSTNTSVELSTTYVNDPNYQYFMGKLPTMSCIPRNKLPIFHIDLDNTINRHAIRYLEDPLSSSSFTAIQKSIERNQEEASDANINYNFINS